MQHYKDIIIQCVLYHYKSYNIRERNLMIKKLSQKAIMATVEKKNSLLKEEPSNRTRRRKEELSVLPGC